MAEKELTVKRIPTSRNSSAGASQLKLYICPTTGGLVRVVVPASETVYGLKVAISKKIRIPPERINLLFKNNILKDGTLYENRVTPESRITLLPNMASGVKFQRSDSSVLQALENLSESQVNDFLSGRAPLLLAMRLGDHMMLVQLQLSTSQCMRRRAHGHNVPAMGPHSVFSQTASVSPASLAEASNSLAQKLHELSRISGHTKVGDAERVTVSSRVPPPSARVCQQHSISNQGAVIDSMHHLGQGVYSGTFSGTLDPNLQDLEGKPRKDVGTIVHILNDLLGASPHACHPILLQRNRAPQSHPVTETKKNSKKSDSMEENVLRGKVRQLQLMMEERRLRRKARREMRAPYQWPSSGICNKKPESSFTHQTIAAGSSGGVSETNARDIPDNIDSSSYPISNMEQESVAV